MTPSRSMKSAGVLTSLLSFEKAILSKLNVAPIYPRNGAAQARL